MRYLITGGAGFIGSHLAATLTEQGDEVVVLDNFSTGKWINIAGLPVRVIEGDIRDPGCVAEAVKGVDAVFHHAALCSVVRSMADPVGTHAINVTGTLVVLDACRQAGVKRFVMASSSSVYGDSEVFPKNEDMKTDPLSPYAVSKLLSEFYCELYWKMFGMETVVLRYFNVFGPRQDPESEYSAVIPRFLHAITSGIAPQIYGDGLQSRDFTFVHDVVQANIAAVNSAQAPGQVMNVACGMRWTLLDVINRLEDILECSTQPVFNEPRRGDVMHSQADIERAGRMLGFAPDVTFEEGLRLTADWFLESFAASKPVLLNAAGYQGVANAR